MTTNIESTSSESQFDKPSLQPKRSELLINLMYFQAAFLAFAYAVGVWQTLVVHEATITLPTVVLHSFMAGTFATITGTVGVIAGLQRMKKVMACNLALFFLIVIGGSSGLAFLGNPNSVSAANLSNLSMITVVAFAVPLSGFSIASVSRSLAPANAPKKQPELTLVYLGLGSLSVHMAAGVGLTSTSYYSFMLFVHFSFAALTGAFALGLLVMLLQDGYLRTARSALAWRSTYSLVGLAFVAIAAGAGGLTVLAGLVSYAVAMAEFAILAYGFLFLSAQVPLASAPLSAS